ncbi:IS110 family transposase [Nostoc sp.]|uniref:IS110 family transposase n=1 Tax=Nostoc sp. TaxID=1180 RepID=UPI003FA5D529
MFQILETRGFEVKLVNAYHIKTLPGHKTDVLDCQWLQQLHSYGLLSGSFRPEDEICILRSYIRQRDSLIRSASVHIQRMQKALTQMNIQLHQAVSDITGTALQVWQSYELSSLVNMTHKYLQLKNITVLNVVKQKLQLYFTVTTEKNICLSCNKNYISMMSTNGKSLNATVRLRIA